MGRDEYVKGVRTIVNRIVEDNGWDPPKEVFEYIDIVAKLSYEDALARVIKEKESHNGRWITLEDANMYTKRASALRAAYGDQYVGMLRDLGEKLRREFDLTELEAFNILRGYHVKDYVTKYERIQNEIPNLPQEENYLIILQERMA